MVSLVIDETKSDAFAPFNETYVAANEMLEANNAGSINNFFIFFLFLNSFTMIIVPKGYVNTFYLKENDVVTKKDNRRNDCL